MVGALRSALKARRRQYEVRAFADTLERSVAERTRELESAHERLEIALDAAELGSWDHDRTTDVVHRTLRHDEIFGYTTLQPSWTSHDLLRHVTADAREAAAVACDAAAALGTLDIECPIDAADGSTRWISVKGRARYDDAGNPTRMVGVIADITARKDAEAQLAQTAKMETIGQLTGGVAHDFNNLLTPIVGSLDLLRRRYADDARATRWVTGALEAAERAATLTQRLLAFARGQTLQPRAVDAHALVHGLVDLIRRSLGPAIAVVIDVPQSLSPARVDPNQLELALLNLAVNARDAMPDGGTLTIAAQPVALDAEDAGHGLAAGRYVQINVIDTGIGMDAPTRARAVEPFFSTKGVGKGTGLGLSMVHGLAAQSGGALDIDSLPGRGTSIAIWLPATTEPTAGTAPAAVEPVAGRSGRVLLVDDEELVRRATAEMLCDLGYRVVEAGSATQAMAQLRAGLCVDLLVTDYLMPGMSGAALVDAMRRAGHALPTLIVTGFANAGVDMPAEVVKLAKPFRQADLAARLDELIEARSTAPVRVPQPAA